MSEEPISSGPSSSALPIIVSAKTGLASKDDSITNKLPGSFSGKTIEDVVKFVLRPDQLEDDERTVAKSIREEMKAENYVVVVNGRNAELADPLSKYLSKRDHTKPDGTKQAYMALEIEVSAVQEGGCKLL